MMQRTLSELDDVYILRLYLPIVVILNKIFRIFLNYMPICLADKMDISHMLRM